MRADSGFCRQNLIRWCERSGVGYVIGLARNDRLESAVAMVEMAMREAFERTGVKQRELGEFRYAGIASGASSRACNTASRASIHAARVNQSRHSH